MAAEEDEACEATIAEEPEEEVSIVPTIFCLIYRMAFFKPRPARVLFFRLSPSFPW